MISILDTLQLSILGNFVYYTQSPIHKYNTRWKTINTQHHNTFWKISIIKGGKYVAKLPEDLKLWFQNVQGKNQHLASWKMFLKFGIFNLILVCCSKVSNNE